MSLDVNSVEIFRISNVLKNFSIGNYATQINDTFIPIIPNNLQNSLKNRFRGYDSENVVHPILSGLRLACISSHARFSADRRGSAHDITFDNVAGGNLPFNTRNISISICT